jgi:iron complex outermembrane receptor protein
MGTDAVKNSNVRLQNYFKPTQDTNAFFRLGYSTMADLSNNYAIAPNLIQTADVAGGSTTNLDVDKKVQVNAFYQNTNFYKQTADNLLSGSKAPYINANYTDPYSTLGASAQYTHDLKAAGIDQYIIGVDARNISASIGDIITQLDANAAVTDICSFLVEDIKNDMHNMEEDSKKINCYAILDLIKDTLKCILDSLKCCFFKIRIE